MSMPDPNKKYTFKDYLTWQGEERWEIIEGTPYLMTAPSWQHQAVLGSLLNQFYNFLTGGSCQVFTSPFDLRLPYQEEKDEDISNVFQPDLVVICDKSKLKGTGYVGIPTLVIEVSSPSTGKIDKILKFNAYEKAGVSEYWIVEPTDKTVSVFTLQEDKGYGRPQTYSEDDTVSVNSFPELEIDLKKVFQDI
ncbi:MAG: Uma2 family endonuclease [Desulfitobacterium sp.]|nr:Uma2 family endonuclease [Desulfitobacterium sp.]